MLTRVAHPQQCERGSEWTEFNAYRLQAREQMRHTDKEPGFGCWNKKAVSPLALRHQPFLTATFGTKVKKNSSHGAYKNAYQNYHK